MAKKPTFAEKKALVAKLEKQLKDDETAVKISRANMRDTARELQNAEAQLFETRKALIGALNSLNERGNGNDKG
jgi:septal ring factor EnvC (AmiA/AmiB activator)